MQLAFLPGLHGTGCLYRPLLDAWGEPDGHKVIALPSEGPQDYATLTSAVREELPKRDPFLLIAESFSGPLAYRLAVDRPPNLCGVVFVCTFLRSPHPMLAGLAVLAPGLLYEHDLLRNHLLPKVLLGRRPDPTLCTLFRKVAGAAPGRVVRERLRTIASLRPPEERLDLPCAYIQASSDRVVPSRCVRLFQKQCRDLTVHRLAGPHLIMQTNPAACAAVLRRECRRVLAASPA